MRWQGMRKSSNVEDRRGIGGRQIAVGGGLGGIVIIVLLLLLGGKPDEVLQTLQGTGGTAAAALRWARSRAAAEVVLAVPVAPAQSLARLRDEADRIVVLATPSPFLAVGEWFRRFDQTTDDEVVAALARIRGDAA